MKMKCISVTWLSKVDLSNINSGEGGAGNVVELKTYHHGKRPYASGQSVRHALREAMERGNPGKFSSTPEAPSCDIKNDWLCDLFGYLNPQKGKGSDRRWSPIKCSPALGQIDSEIVTDMLTRVSDLEKNTSIESDAGKKDSRIAYVQLAESIFKTGLVVDANAIGRKLIVEGDAKEKKITKREWQDEIDEEERQVRIRAILLALAQMGDFAKQARNAISFAPDILFASVSPVYTQRSLRTLDLVDGKVDLPVFKTVVDDLKELGAELLVGFTPNVISNDAEFLKLCTDCGISVDSPVKTLKMIAEKVG